MIKALMMRLKTGSGAIPAALGRTIKRFGQDIRAGALIYVTLTLPVIVGTALLAIDGSRLMSMHTSLQKAGDALALAAAGELDTFPGAIVRANHVIANLIGNGEIFSSTPADITPSDVTVRFLSDIPTNDSDPIPNSMVIDTVNDTRADQKARYVEVTVNPQTLNTIFPATFIGGVNSAQASTVSVAGNTQIVCKLMPLFICNPYEDVNNTDIYDDGGLFAAATNDAERRKLILMKAAPGGAADYFPGDFGFLDMGNGANDLADALAGGTAEACFAQDGVATETGHKQGPVQAAINTRFGLYGNPGFKNEHSTPRYRPARNVRKAQDQAASKVCEKWEPEANPADAMPLPQDPCLAAGNCPNMGGRQEGANGWTVGGAGGYWETNFGTAAPGLFNGKADGTATRYDVYREELAQGVVGTPSAGGETGLASQNSCSTLATNDTPDRRLINGAILNCRALDAPGSGYNLKGHVTNVPVLAFAEFFLAFPMQSTNGNSPSDEAADLANRSILAELRRVIRQGSVDATAYDMVQLYR